MPAFVRLGFALVLGLVTLHDRPAQAQDDGSRDRWQVTLDDDRYVWNVGLVELSGDTLIVRQSDSLVRTPVGRIRELRRFQKMQLEVGDEHGSAIRALSGAQDDIYDLAALGPGARREAIQKILAQYPPHEAP